MIKRLGRVRYVGNFECPRCDGCSAKGIIRGSRHLSTEGDLKTTKKRKKVRNSSRRTSVKKEQNIIEESLGKSIGLDQSLNDRETIIFENEKAESEKKVSAREKKLELSGSQRLLGSGSAKSIKAKIATTRSYNHFTIEMDEYYRR